MKKLVVLSIISIVSLNLFCQINWTKHPDNPVLTPGSPGEWDEAGIFYPRVIYYDNTYHMWYSGSKTDSTGIGHATSQDGVTWTKNPNNPVLDVGPDGAWDDQNAYAATVLLIDSIFHMWYNGQATSFGVDNNKIGHATSSDGITWTKDPNNPVLTTGPIGAWDDEWSAYPNVVHTDETFHMWYSGFKEGSGISIGHATSPDGVAWTKDSQNPVITSSGEWEVPLVFPGGTIFNGSNYQMWYSGGIAWKTMIGYATSEDGSQWEKNSQPVLRAGSAGSWEGQWVGGSSVLFDTTKNTYKMWYTGSSTSEFGDGSIGYAETYEPAWTMLYENYPGGMAVVVDSLIYSFAGGGEGWAIGNEAWSFNTNSNEWIQLTDMPIPLTDGGIGNIGDNIYLVGGWTTGATGDWVTTDSVLQYNLATDKFSSKAPSGYKLGAVASCVMNDKICLFGGWGSPFPVVHHAHDATSYDPLTETWDENFFPDMQFPHLMHGSAEFLNGEVYVIGGVGPDPHNIQPSEKFDGENWVTIAKMPVPVTLHNSIVHNGKILVFGGDSIWSREKSYSTNFIQEYDPVTNSWKMMEPMPFQRTAMTGGKVGNYMYLMGGSRDQRDPDNNVPQVWKFNLDSLKEWVVPGLEVMLSDNNLTLEVDDTVRLSAGVLPTYAADRSVSWSSSDETIATVSADGEVIAKSGGNATITASANGGDCSASCEITVSTVGTFVLKKIKAELFPNPTEGFLNLNMDRNSQYSIEVISNTGQVLLEREFTGYNQMIDLSSFETGVYFITIRSMDFVTTRKIIKL